MVDWRRVKEWFHKNDFFERTPLNGWAYIYAANGIIEITFWYTTILSLLVLTMYNVHQVTQHYLSKPTEYKIYMDGSTDHIEIPELTLTLKAAMFDWSEQLPLRVIVNEKPSSGAWSKHFSSEQNDQFRIFHDFICDSGNYVENVHVDWLRDISFMILGEPFLKGFYDSVVVNHSAALADFSDPRILHEWKDEMERAKQEYYEYWVSVLTTPTHQQNRSLIGNRLTQIQDSLITRRPVDTFIKLLALKAVESGEDNILAKLGFTKDDSIIEKFTATATQLVEDIVANLANLIHFQMKPQGSVSLQDWTYDEWRIKHEFKFLLKIPPGAKNLQLRIYHRSFMWLKHVLQALDEVVKNFLQPLSILELQCAALHTTFENLIKDNSDLWMVSYSEDFAHVSDTVSAWRVKAAPNYYNHISLAPHTVFQSTVDGCLNESLESCKRQCVRSKAATKCSCVPWNVANLLDSSDWPSEELCDGRCAWIAGIVEQCTEECGQKTNQSCQVTLTHIKGELQEPHDRAFEIMQKMDINISVAEFYPHAKQFKEYALTGTGYLSLLGGAIEFWSAMDVLGIIHLLIYVIIGIYHILKAKERPITEAAPQRTTMTLESMERKYATAIESLNEGQLPRWKVLVKWLKGNQFYEQTSLTGYAFITEAESVIEIVFWYGIIALFATLAVYNLRNNIHDYISRTTKVNIVPSTGTTPLPNATLNMILPIIMLTEYNARDHYNITEEQSASDLLDTLQRLASEPPIDVVSVSQQLVDDWRSLINAQEGELFILNKSEQALSSISHGDVFEKRLSFVESIARLEDWIARADNLSWSELQLPSSEIMSGPRTGVDGLFFKLWLLRAIKTGESIFKQLGGGGAQAAEMLEQQGSSTEQLYNAVIGQLSNVLHVRGAQARISDIDFDEKYLQKGTFALQVELAFPPGATSAHIRVDSLLFRWMQMVQAYYYNDVEGDQHTTTIDTTNTFSQNYFIFFNYEMSDYYLWIYDITYGTLSTPTADMPILTSMWAGIQDYALFIQWSYQSAKNICPYKNQEQCIEDCVRHEYLSFCDCLPWSVMEPNEQYRLCNHPCKIQTNKCITKCINDFCDKHVHKFVVNNFKDVDHSNLSLFEFRLSVMQNLHMHFVETYEHSLGTFLAHIGGLLEFWLGCNVIALLHGMVYLFKYIYYYLSAKKDNSDTSSALNRLERTLQEIAALRGQLCIDMTAARVAAQNGTLREADDNSATHWLYKNRFYETTSITGFQFIAHARLGLERLFWAALILIFFIITVFNVYTTIDYYGHKPTLLSTKILHGSQFQLENFTLKFKADLIELTKTFPTPLQYFTIDLAMIDTTNMAMTDHLACMVTSSYLNDLLNTEQYIRGGALYELANSEHWIFNQTEWLEVPPVQSSDEILQNWLKLFEKATKPLLKFWERHNSPLSETNPGYQRQRKIETELAHLLGRPLRERNLSFLHGFFLLEAFNTGSNPQTKLLELSNEGFDASFFKQHKQHSNNFQPIDIGELLGGVTAFELVKRMEKELSKMILIRVIDEPDAKISLRSWSYESESYVLGNDSPFHQNLEYHIMLPQNNSRKQVQIVTYSFLHMWHNYILGSIRDHYKKNGPLSEQFLCHWDINIYNSIESLIETANIFFGTVIMNQGSGTNEYLHVGTENFDFVAVNEGVPEEMLLHLTGAFDSNTHNCSTLSSQQCLDHCLRAYSMEVCGCQPWGLLYLGAEGPACTAPCSPPTHCLKQCQHVMQHPCHFVQLKAQRTKFESKSPFYYSTKLDTAQHHVVIKTKAKSYISHTESYETVGSFVAQLGNILDLWLGINLLSIIHLVLFIMKTVFRKRTCGIKSSLVENTEPSFLVHIELMEKRIGESIDLFHKETKLKIMKQKANKPDM